MGDQKASFSIATALRCSGGRYSIPSFAPLYPWSLPYNVDHARAVKKKGSSKVCGWICSLWPSWVWESQHASTGNSVSWSLGHSSRSSFHHRSPEHQELRDLNLSAQPSPRCHDNVFLSDLLWALLGQIFQFPHWHQTMHLLSLTVLIHEILYLVNQL